MNHTCEPVRAQLALLLYGELSFDEEEAVESHLESCAECRFALDRQREVHAAFDGASVEPPASLLKECRDDLMAALASHQPVARSWWHRLALGPLAHARGSVGVANGTEPRPSGSGLSAAAWFRPSWFKPATAVALLALGYFGARVFPGGAGAFSAMTAGDPGSARVRLVQTTPDGRIQITLDETHQRTLSGAADDPHIRALLLAAAKDPADPGLRAETVAILNGSVQSADVRDMLLYALRHDQNAGVRLKAMEGLKGFAQQPEVRTALAGVLLSDENPGLRTQAIDLLTAHGGALDREIVGALQQLMRTESNTYVRQRSQHVLQTMNASWEMY